MAVTGATPKKNVKPCPTEKVRIIILQSIRQALLLDQKAAGTSLEGKWAVAKEMDGLQQL
jgi:hypothetical protein